MWTIKCKWSFVWNVQRWVMCLIFMVALTACSGGSGDGVVSNDPPIVPAGWEREAAPLDLSTDASNVHYNSGGRRIVRINDTTLALVVNGASDYLYRSKDDGVNWIQIDSEDGYSGCLVSGINNYVYHFSQFGTDLRMVKLLYDGTPATPVIIYNGLQDTNHGVYQMHNATVDADGNLYLFYHHDTGAVNADSLYMLKSTDEGISWSNPVTVRTGTSGHSYGFIHSDVTINGDIVVAYSEWTSLTVQFAISTDQGDTWTTTALNEINGDIYNPSILPVGGSDIFVFAQSNPDNGLVFKKSTDSGVTWTESWTSIQANHANGYADPSPALGNDGIIYVAFRGAETFTTLSDDLREFITLSIDSGKTWIFPDNHLSGGRVGTRSNLRYQTWHNYGGPLEWTWLEEDGEDTEVYPTMYDINKDVTIATP